MVVLLDPPLRGRSSRTRSLTLPINNFSTSLRKEGQPPRTSGSASVPPRTVIRKPFWCLAALLLIPSAQVCSQLVIRTQANQRIAKADKILVQHKLRSMELELNFAVAASMAPRFDNPPLCPMAPLPPPIRIVLPHTKEERTTIFPVT